MRIPEVNTGRTLRWVSTRIFAKPGKWIAHRGYDIFQSELFGALIYAAIGTMFGLVIGLALRWPS